MQSVMPLQAGEALESHAVKLIARRSRKGLIMADFSGCACSLPYMVLIAACWCCTCLLVTALPAQLCGHEHMGPGTLCIPPGCMQGEGSQGHPCLE